MNTNRGGAEVAAKWRRGASRTKAPRVGRGVQDWLNETPIAGCTPALRRAERSLDAGALGRDRAAANNGRDTPYLDHAVRSRVVNHREWCVELQRSPEVVGKDNRTRGQCQLAAPELEARRGGGGPTASARRRASERSQFTAGAPPRPIAEFTDEPPQSQPKMLWAKGGTQPPLTRRGWRARAEWHSHPEVGEPLGDTFPANGGFAGEQRRQSVRRTIKSEAQRIDEHG
jgi:hypothetical protein